MNIQKSKDIYLVAGFNRPYLKKSEDYLASMNENSNVNNVIITLDFDIDSETEKKYGHIQFKKILSSQIQCPNPNTCMQHGGFLEALGFVNDDAVIIFTDTDIKIQRPFSEADLKMLLACEDNEVLVNFNMSEDGVLLDETEELEPNITNKELVKKYPEFADFKSYNTGVLITNYRTYKNIYQKYNQYWPDFSLLFNSYVKQQLLLCYVIQKHFCVKVLPYTIHSQAHSSPVKKHSSSRRVGYIGEGILSGFKLCIGSDVVVFNHHIKHENELKIAGLQRRVKKLFRFSLFLSVLLLIAVLIILLNRFH